MKIRDAAVRGRQVTVLKRTQMHATPFAINEELYSNKMETTMYISMCDRF